MHLGKATSLYLFNFPVQSKAVKSEYYAQMWIRNGYTMTSSIYLYDRPSFAHGFYGADLALIRYAAANLEQEFFINILIHSFHLPDCLALSEGEEESGERVITQKNWVSFLFDGYLRYDNALWRRISMRRILFLDF